MNLVKSIMHNLGVAIVGLVIAFAGTRLDRRFGIDGFQSVIAAAVGSLLMAVGFLVRVWATYYFYQNRMRVISTDPQGTLLTSGPYRYSRNPLYLGGNVFVFFGAALLLGSPIAVGITAFHLPFVDLFIRREERQLEQRFGKDWVRYRRSVRRWL
jgi:protein-S-isoprenylcysteine O-methyltransferase Ste14